VPGDLALVSFDEPAYADLLEPPMTSLDRHDRELGRRAAELLLGALDGSGIDASSAVLRVPLELRVRRSCGCVA
jgi:LacI family transcriptional regulator